MKSLARLTVQSNPVGPLEIFALVIHIRRKNSVRLSCPCTRLLILRVVRYGRVPLYPVGMIWKRFREFRQRNDRRLVVSAMELVKERIAIGASVKETREWIMIADKGLLLRIHDDLRQRDGLVGVDLLVRCAIQLERSKDADPRELHRRRSECYGVTRLGIFHPDNGMSPVFLGYLERTRGNL